MSDLAWKAEGIQAARAAGGVDLDVYQPPGFARPASVRRVKNEGGYVGSGLTIYVDPDPDEFAKARKEKP